MNLVDSVSSDGRKYKSLIQLSHSHFFERKYSSITDAIGDGLPHAKWDMIAKIMLAVTTLDEEKKVHCFIVDCTPQSRQYAKKMQERYITHYPNPAPGNKPICVGHAYSVLVRLPSDPAARAKHWVNPLSAKMVKSSQKGNEVGMHQLVDYIKSHALSGEMTISVGDTLYGSKNCRKIALELEKHVHIFRLNSTRNVFFMPSDVECDSSRKGRKKEFGDKMHLPDVDIHPKPDQETQTYWTTKKGKQYRVVIKCWNNMLLRGSRDFRSSKYPLNIIQVTVINEENELVFKKPLWLAVLGGNRHQLSLVEVYENYKARYDIEHFFRFGKQNLLMDSYQTTEIEHEESWWQLCMLAYTQLYLAREIVPSMPEPWERYLPEYKDTENKKNFVSSPSKTQHGFSSLLKIIGTPAQPPVPRGNPQGRKTGETQLKKETVPVIFKSKKTPKKADEAIVSGSEKATDISDLKRMDELLIFVRKSLEQMGLSVPDFSEVLLDSS
jgi:hypothetical protein